MLILSSFFLVRLIQLRNNEKGQMFAILALAALCQSCVFLYRISQPTTWITGSISMSGWLFCMIFAYPGLYAYLNGYKEPIKLNTRFTLTMSIIDIIIIFIRWFHQDSSAPLAETQMFNFSLPFFASNLLYYGSITAVDGLLAYVYWASMRTKRGISVFTVRRAFGVIVWSVAASTNGLVMILNLFLLFFTNDAVALLNTICKTGRLISAIFIILSLVIPSTWYLPAVHFFQKTDNKRNQYNLHEMHMLRKIIQSIVPSIYRPVRDYILTIQPDIDPVKYQQFILIRCISEINDGRRIIWSYNPYTRSFSAEEEGEYILSLIREGNKIKDPGPYRPATPDYMSGKRKLSSDMRLAIKHNKKVLKYILNHAPELRVTLDMTITGLAHMASGTTERSLD